MGQDPDQLKRDIERTRQSLTQDVDALADKTSPSRVASRQVDKAKSGLTSIKESVMGKASDARHSTSAGMHSAGSGVSGTASSAVQGVSGTATSVIDGSRQQARGNPMAAGLIAFGVGWLASSLIPATAKEEQLASKAMDKAQEYKEPVLEKAKEVASEVKEEVAPQAQQAVESVKQTAQESAQTVKGEATSGAQQVKEDATSGAQEVRGQASGDGRV